MDDADTGLRLFSFDMPNRLFELYESEGVLSPAGAADLKQQQLSQIEAIVADGTSMRQIVFELDGDWIERVLDHVRTRREPLDR